MQIRTICGNYDTIGFVCFNSTVICEYFDDIARVMECVDDYNYTSIVTKDGKVHTISLRYSQVVGKITDALEKRGPSEEKA